MNRPIQAIAGALGALLLGACASLLPVSSTVTEVEWNSFEEARSTIEKITATTTRREDLSSLGIDPARNPSVTLLTYSDILLRFPVGVTLRPEELESGLRACLSAGQRCTGFSVAVRKLRRTRTGNFWADALNFRRETDVTGWTFNALVLMVDDVVTYSIWGGQPNVHEHELVRNPLGPLQLWGEHLPALAR